MGKTKIEWTEQTWNPVTGCTPTSEGCIHCYANRMSKRLAGRYGYPAAPDNFKVTLHPDRLDEPLRLRKPRMVFVVSMGDLFHEDVPFEFIDKVFTIMMLCQQHIFQCLSKRPTRMAEYFKSNPLARISAEGRISTQARLSVNHSNDRQSSDHDRSTSLGMDIFQWANAKRHDNQSQEWYQGRQQTGELGIGNNVRTTHTCPECAESETPSPNWIKASKDSLDRRGCNQDSGVACQWNDGQGHCGSIQNEAQGHIGNLLPQDLEAYLDWPLPNVQLGVTAENQARANERIPILLQIPAAVRFVSVEPMLGAVNLERWMWPTHWHHDSKYQTPEEAIAAGAYAEKKPQALVSADARFLNWVICGAETGPGARFMRHRWAEILRDQCRDANVPFFFKRDSDGSRTLDGQLWEQYPDA
jgi:protein gp37